jgi:hypothetical protein
VLVPEVTGRANTRLVPTSPAAALAALAPSTLFQLAHAGSEAFTALSGLTRAVPCHRLFLGGRPHVAAETIAELLESA